MSKSVRIIYPKEIADYKFDKIIEEFPKICPLCNIGIKVEVIIGNIKEGNDVEIVCLCPVCNHLFTSYYSAYKPEGSKKYHFKLEKTFPKNIKIKEFSEIIQSISNSFVRIYQQSEKAEGYELSDIAGMGYRKALEFLIKDYLIKNKPDEADDIKSKMLGTCINKYVDDTQIKECARRASWLGNDETHYERRRVGYNIYHLKELIFITIYWIEREEKTKQYLNEMPN